MTKAKTVVIDAHGDAEKMHLTDRNVGDPEAGEIRIRHSAIGLNFIDVYQRSGLYKLDLPHALGMEGAGIVEAVGDGVTHLKPGDRAAYASMPPGSYSEARVMPAAQVCPIPDGVSDADAAAVMLKGMTTHYLFRRTTPIATGDTVLFHAAAGGVGLIACQWARSEGIRLIGTAGSDEKCQMALDHGADHMINYRTEDFPARVKELTDGKGVVAVMDGVGKDTFEGSLQSLAPLGMLMSFGNASGPVPPFEIARLGALGSLKVTRPTLFTHIADHATCQQMAADVFEKVASGDIKLQINQRYALADVVQAHKDLEARKTTGATIIHP